MEAISPLDGRYAAKLDPLRPFFSEEALMRARIIVEVRYFEALAAEKGITELKPLTEKQKEILQKIIDGFGVREAQKVRQIEKRTNHDVKAIEYYLRTAIEKQAGPKIPTEFIHFGLTSEDVNNLAYGLLIQGAIKSVLRPRLQSVINALSSLARRTKRHKILSLTHGQPATPSLLGKEIQVFIDRLERQKQQLAAFRMQGKFGGAVGTYGAHKAAYPDVKWEAFGKKFIRSLGLSPLAHTTQINPHDDVAELSHLLSRINVISLDLARDMWLYISRGIFSQKVVKGEVGSSTMPHKVNPIDFENAEGNLGISTALFTHFAEKLPVSRLQRDLSDSTVQRSIGVACGYHFLALLSLERGLKKLTVNVRRLREELELHPEVHAEAIQTVMRRHGYADAYERLKELTRGERVTLETFRAFIKDLRIPEAEKKRLLEIVGK